MYKSLFEILEMEFTTDKKAIEKQYKSLLFKYHPDRNKDPNAENRFKEIRNAYDKLMKLNLSHLDSSVNFDNFSELRKQKRKQRIEKTININVTIPELLNKNTISANLTIQFKNDEYGGEMQIPIYHTLTKTGLHIINKELKHNIILKLNINVNCNHHYEDKNCSITYLPQDNLTIMEVKGGYNNHNIYNSPIQGVNVLKGFKKLVYKSKGVNGSDLQVVENDSTIINNGISLDDDIYGYLIVILIVASIVYLGF
jgi:hypothetical protein